MLYKSNPCSYFHWKVAHFLCNLIHFSGFSFSFIINVVPKRVKLDSVGIKKNCTGSDRVGWSDVACTFKTAQLIYLLRGNNFDVINTGITQTIMNNFHGYYGLSSHWLGEKTTFYDKRILKGVVCWLKRSDAKRKVRFLNSTLFLQVLCEYRYGQAQI